MCSAPISPWIIYQMCPKPIGSINFFIRYKILKFILTKLSWGTMTIARGEGDKIKTCLGSFCNFMTLFRHLPYNEPWVTGISTNIYMCKYFVQKDNHIGPYPSMFSQNRLIQATSSGWISCIKFLLLQYRNIVAWVVEKNNNVKN